MLFVIYTKEGGCGVARSIFRKKRQQWRYMQRQNEPVSIDSRGS